MTVLWHIIGIALSIVVICFVIFIAWAALAITRADERLDVWDDAEVTYWSREDELQARRLMGSER